MTRPRSRRGSTRFRKVRIISRIGNSDHAKRFGNWKFDPENVVHCISAINPEIGIVEIHGLTTCRVQVRSSGLERPS